MHKEVKIIAEIVKLFYYFYLEAPSATQKRLPNFIIKGSEYFHENTSLLLFLKENKWDIFTRQTVLNK